MSNMLIQLRKSLGGCSNQRANYEGLNTEQLQRRLLHLRRQLWIVGAIMVGTMALVYVITGQREEVLAMFTISGSSTIWITYEDYRKRSRLIKEILREREG